jgi:DNA ligase D-like protein (predicted 3'-phosphoesterase)
MKTKRFSKKLLGEYRRKRKFGKTPEPRGKLSLAEGHRFVVQEHWAKNHHFDFRLEMEGALKSWAVPKGLPLRSGPKRLALETENHPLEYIDFQGIIPEGNYGAGRVEIFDQGEYELTEKSEGKIFFNLAGKKIKGDYGLVKIAAKNAWLLFKLK